MGHRDSGKGTAGSCVVVRCLSGFIFACGLGLAGWSFHSLVPRSHVSVISAIPLAHSPPSIQGEHFRMNPTQGAPPTSISSEPKLVSPPGFRTPGYSKNSEEAANTTIHEERSCEDMEADMVRDDTWYPEVIHENKDNSEWVRKRCYSPRGKPKNWSDSWPSGVCKRWYWNRAEHSRDSTYWVFQRGAITFQAPFRHITPLLHLPKPARNQDAVDADVYTYLRHLHTRPCSLDTPVAIFVGGRGGLGLEINSILVAHHIALSQNRTLVILFSQLIQKDHTVRFMYTNDLGAYSLFEDLILPSSCQNVVPQETLRDWVSKNSGDSQGKRREGEKEEKSPPKPFFRDFKVFGQQEPFGAYPLPKQFAFLSAVTWMRILARLVFSPSKRLLQAVLKRAGAEDEAPPDKDGANHPNINKNKNNKNFGGRKSTPAHTLPRPPLERLGRILADKLNLTSSSGDFGRYVGLHVRTGDLCSSRCLLRGLNRPRHCVRELKPYLLTLAARVPESTKYKVYLASDSPDIIREMHNPEHNLGHTVISAEMGREKYTQNATVIIEERTELIREEILEELLIELSLLASSWMVLGSFYSNVPRLAMTLGQQEAYVSLDTLWCFNLGCSTWEVQHALNHEAFARSLGFVAGTMTYLQMAWEGKQPQCDVGVFTEMTANIRKISGGLVQNVLSEFLRLSMWDERELGKQLLLIPNPWGECYVATEQHKAQYLKLFRGLGMSDPQSITQGGQVGVRGVGGVRVGEVCQHLSALVRQRTWS